MKWLDVKPKKDKMKGVEPLSKGFELDDRQMSFQAKIQDELHFSDWTKDSREELDASYEFMDGLIKSKRSSSKKPSNLVPNARSKSASSRTGSKMETDEEQKG